MQDQVPRPFLPEFLDLHIAGYGVGTKLVHNLADQLIFDLWVLAELPHGPGQQRCRLIKSDVSQQSRVQELIIILKSFPIFFLFVILHYLVPLLLPCRVLQ